jgi:hypothetical protein
MANRRTIDVLLAVPEAAAWTDLNRRISPPGSITARSCSEGSRRGGRSTWTRMNGPPPSGPVLG